MIELKRYKGNPIISPNPENYWESKATFNPGIVQLKGKIYILYRAVSGNNVSRIGMAVTSDGFTIEERLEHPVYVPREEFERKIKGRIETGCEDPRLTIIDGRIYMCYTAFAADIPYVRVALTSIRIKDFLRRRWDKWERPVLISPPGIWDKDACVIKVRRKLYAFFHRPMPAGEPLGIWLSFVNSLDFRRLGWQRGNMIVKSRPGKWDDGNIGIAGPPFKTSEGWVLIYHARCTRDQHYRLGAILLDSDNPSFVLKRLDYPILEPKEWYEKEGLVNNVVFSCGQAVIDNTLFIYYGGADKYTAVATVDLDDLLSELTKDAWW